MAIGTVFSPLFLQGTIPIGRQEEGGWAEGSVPPPPPRCCCCRRCCYCNLPTKQPIYQPTYQPTNKLINLPTYKFTQCTPQYLQMAMTNRPAHTLPITTYLPTKKTTNHPANQPIYQQIHKPTNIYKAWKRAWSCLPSTHLPNIDRPNNQPTNLPLIHPNGYDKY